MSAASRGCQRQRRQPPEPLLLAPRPVPPRPPPRKQHVPVIDHPDALRGGSFTGVGAPPAVASTPFLPFDYVRTVGGITPPAGMGGGMGGGGGGGGGSLPPDQGSSIIVPPTVILPSPLPPTGPTVLPAVPEPQTWAMLLAGLALLACATLRRRPAAA